MILVLNAGSSSLKVEVFDQSLASAISGQVSSIGTTGELRLGDRRDAVETNNHAEALALMLAALDRLGPSPVHRYSFRPVSERAGRRG